MTNRNEAFHKRNPLLTRDQFRNDVFGRDGHKCVICGAVADENTGVKLDAHHIIERRLWDDGGYYLNNGATLCSVDTNGGSGGCHLKAETTELSVEDVRIAAGIKDILVPSGMYQDQPYDKWGNPVLPNRTRAKGPLFYDESVRKVLIQEHLPFTSLVKYQRTLHLPWSQSINDDDRVLKDCSHFHGKEIVVTEKILVSEKRNAHARWETCHR